MPSSIVIKLFLVNIAFLLICYVVGRTLVRLFRLALGEQFFSLFLSLILGLTVVISVYAIACAHGNTVQSAVMVLILIVIWQMKQTPVSISLINVSSVAVNRNKKSILLSFLLINILVFCAQYYILYDSASDYLKTPFVDYVYYSRLALPLNYLGLETNSLEVIYPQFLTQQPYHYFEIWLNALLIRVTGLPSAWTFFISASTVMLTIVCIGFIVIFTHFHVKTKWAIVLAVLFLFVTGVKWPFLQKNNFVVNGALLMNTIVSLHPKFAPIYLFILLAGLLLLKRSYLAAGATLAILPLIFVSTTPVIGVGMVILTAYLFLTKQLTLGKAFAFVLPIVLSAVYVVLFYLLHPEPYQFPSTGRIFALESIVPKTSEITTIINIAIGVFVNFAVYFAAYILLILLIILLRRETKLLNGVPLVIWIWFGSSLLTAAAMRAFGTHYLDSFQFFSNTMMPLISVVLAMLLAVVLQRASAGFYLLTVSTIAVLILINFSVANSGATRYSLEFMQQVSQAISKTGTRGAYILADSDYQNAYTLSSDSYTAGAYVSNFKNNYALISLSELDIDSLSTDNRFMRDSTQAEQIIRKSSIYRFAKFHSLNKQKFSLDSLKYKFITENSINFLCASKLAKLPSILNPLVSVVYTDTLSGEKFYILHTKGSVDNLTPYN